MHEVIYKAVEDIFATPRQNGICIRMHEYQISYAERETTYIPGLDEFSGPSAESVGRQAEPKGIGDEEAKMVADSSLEAPRHVLRINARVCAGR